MSSHSNRLQLENHFKLGTFATNCNGGLTFTTVPERWQSTWENNLRLAQMLDEAGMDFMLPVARWIGYGGKTDCHGDVLETMTWAAGLLARTRRISVLATIHTAVNHPVVVAKQMATIDQLGRGRAGLNIVAGWNEPEYAALGLTLPDDHETRYAYAQEWFEIVHKLWTHPEPFDWRGRYFNLQRIYSHPQPFTGIPSIVNAAGSGQGRDFATRNANFLLTPAVDLVRSVDEVRSLKNQAAALGREVDVLTVAYIVCRPTEKQAIDYVQHVAHDNRDTAGVERSMSLQMRHGKSFPKDVWMTLQERVSMGHGGFPLVGTPQQVADGIISLRTTGFDGAAISFVDYNAEFPFFRDNVLPILEQRGVRRPVVV